jgi:hypothetical protein
MYDDAPFALLDDAWQNGECGRQAGVSVREDINIRAFDPCYIDWCMERLLNVSAVEIKRR